MVRLALRSAGQGGPGSRWHRDLRTLESAPEMPEPAAFPEGRLRELALLARLELPAERHAAVQMRLGGVVAAFAALRAVDTSAVTAPPPCPALPLRADEPEPVLPVEAVLRNAARTAGDCFLVPRVVDG